MRVFITGIAGFIGSSIADALIEQGHEVEGIDNLSTGRRENWPYTNQVGDIRNDADLSLAWGSRSYDVVYHCAASYKDRDDWERDASTNVLGTINVLRQIEFQAAFEPIKIVYFQTSLCYGLNPDSPVSLADPLRPTGSYAVSKTAGERYIADSGLDYVSLRLANIYGPRNLSGPVPTFFKRLSEGEPCTVVDSRRDFVYIDDLVEVAVRAATQGRGVYHVASGHDVAIEDIYGAVSDSMGVAAEVEFRPRGPDDAATILLDPIETYVEFGWRANTPLISGIAEAVRWYKANPVTETYTHLSSVEAKA